MFKFLKKKTALEKLNKQYKILLSEANTLSTSNRKASDAKVFEAESVLDKIKALENNSIK
ncbi:MAG: Lacal_2735 family protein [Crocinitomicaceae bacterium]|jgi:hypothetical protein